MSVNFQAVGQALTTLGTQIPLLAEAPVITSLANITNTLQNIQNDLHNMRTDLTAVRTDLNTLRTDVRTDLTAVRTDLDTVRTDVAVLRTDLNAVRADLNAVHEVTTALQHNMTTMDAGLNNLIVEKTTAVENTVGRVCGVLLIVLDQRSSARAHNSHNSRPNHTFAVLLLSDLTYPEARGLRFPKNSADLINLSDQEVTDLLKAYEQPIPNDATHLSKLEAFARFMGTYVEVANRD